MWFNMRSSYHQIEKNDRYKGLFGFFKKHFNGDYSLARSFWVNTYLIQILATMFVILCGLWIRDNLPPRYSALAAIIATIVGTFLYVWSICGTWASAKKHTSRGGKEIWASIALALIILSALTGIGKIKDVYNSFKESWKVVTTGGQIGPKVSLQISADGKSIILKGAINDGLSESLLNALELAPSVKTVVLQSEGGWVSEGKKLSKVISDRGLNTYIEQECVSACTIAFLAGKERLAASGAKIGFHLFSSIGASSSNDISNQIAFADVKEAYTHAGLSPEFIAKVISTPNDKIWYPSYAELMKNGVLTRVGAGVENSILDQSSQIIIGPDNVEYEFPVDATEDQILEFFRNNTPPVALSKKSIKDQKKDLLIEILNKNKPRENEIDFPPKSFRRIKEKGASANEDLLQAAEQHDRRYAAVLKATSDESLPPLHLATIHGANYWVTDLLAAGADVNVKDEFGRTPLHWAAEEGHYAVAVLLLGAGASLEAKDLDGRTPLYYAERYGNGDVMKLLNKSKASQKKSLMRIRGPDGVEYNLPSDLTKDEISSFLDQMYLHHYKKNLLDRLRLRRLPLFPIPDLRICNQNPWPDCREI